MGVYRHGGTAECHSHDHVGSLAPDAGEGLEVVHVVRHDATEVCHEFHCHGVEMLRLAVGIGNGLDEGADFVHGAGCQRSGVGEAGEKGGRSHIHPLVGALGGKHDRHEEFVGGIVVQFSVDGAYMFGKPGKDVLESFFFCHSVVLFFGKNSILKAIIHYFRGN